MNNAYEAIFIIPYDAKKRLTDDGWEFDSLNKLSADKIDRLLNSLELTLIETYEDVGVYSSNGIKVSVFHDSTGRIEYVFCQIFDLAYKQMISEFCSNDSSLEFFKPA